MRALLIGGFAAMAVGVALVVAAVLTGGAELALVVIFPVVWGSSALLIGGIALIVLGFLLIPFGWVGGPAEPEEEGQPVRDSAAGGSTAAGGFVLVGPVPIFFGAWRNVSRPVRWALALVGLAALAILVAVMFLVLA